MADPLVSSETDEWLVYRDRQLRVERSQRPLGLRFIGEIDISNSVALTHALTQMVDGQPHIHLDFRSLVFCDLSGIRALVNVAEAMGPDRRLLIHGLAPELEHVIGLVGWSEKLGLSFCGCTEVAP